MSSVGRAWAFSFTAILASIALCSPTAATKLEVLYEFDGSGGCDPTGGVIVDSTGITNGVPGTLYGTAKFCGSGTVWSLTPTGDPRDLWKFAVIHPFKGGDDGANPGTGLLLDEKKGNLYGTTESVAGCQNTCGSVFRLDRPKKPRAEWKIHQLAKLEYSSDTTTIDYTPNSAPVFAGCENNELLWGTADGLAGAIYQVQAHKNGAPPAFLYSPDLKVGKYVGDHPQGLAIIRCGEAYGTTFSGGPNGDGTVFRILFGEQHSTNVIEFAFDGPLGAYPLTGPTVDASNTLYGTTWEGGDPTACPNSPGCGTVWKILRGSKQVLVLHSFAFFTNPNDGQTPMSPLLLDPGSGTLYGTTFYGGTGTQCGGDGGSCGTVFQVDADGTYDVLWDLPNNGSASNNCNGKDCPAAPQGLLALSDGAVYGTSYDGGKQCGSGHYLGCGTVWKLAP